MAGAGVAYDEAGGQDWSARGITPTALTEHDFSETLNFSGWDGTDYIDLAYELTTSTSGRIRIDTFLCTFGGSDEVAGSTPTIPGGGIWGSWFIIGPPYGGFGGYFSDLAFGGIGSGFMTHSFAVTAGDPVRLRCAGTVFDADGNDTNTPFHFRLRVSDVTPWSTVPDLWAPELTWPEADGPRDPSTIVTSLPGRRRFRPR